MIYVERNTEGQIINVELTSNVHRKEISVDDPELIEFIKNSPNCEELTNTILHRLDLDMVRVIEDLFDIMIERDLIRFTDLPLPVQEKLMFKRKIRNLSNEKTMLQEEEILNL
ncbi:MAG: hypothetical protein L3J38_00220 [Thiomicrorhabdus sp.]|nr:hypothetical protein [Thiomicrorhabdus sp.]